MIYNKSFKFKTKAKGPELLDEVDAFLKKKLGKNVPLRFAITDKKGAYLNLEVTILES